MVVLGVEGASLKKNLAYISHSGKISTLPTCGISICKERCIHFVANNKRNRKRSGFVGSILAYLPTLYIYICTVHTNERHSLGLRPIDLHSLYFLSMQKKPDLKRAAGSRTSGSIVSALLHWFCNPAVIDAIFTDTRVASLRAKIIPKRHAKRAFFRSTRNDDRRRWLNLSVPVKAI